MDFPLVVSVADAAFVGVSVRLGIRAGGPPTGDDALAMGLVKLWDISIERVSLISDLAVLLLSLSFIPACQIACSLLTVMRSSQIMELIHRLDLSRMHVKKHRQGIKIL